VYQGIVDDEPVLRNYLLSMAAADVDPDGDGYRNYQVLRGVDSIYLAPVVSQVSECVCVERASE
jgi:hypothetical protein